MRIQFRYKAYPLSPELTAKSQRVCILTSVLYGLILGVIPGVFAAIAFPDSVAIPMILIFAGIVAGPLLLRALRKKKLAQFDAEYGKILQSVRK